MKRTNFCTLKACPSRDVTSSLTFKSKKHSLPAGCDPNQRRLWKQFVDRANRISPTPDGKKENIKLCSDHFGPNFLTVRGCLKANAVPTIFPMFTAHIAHKLGLTPQLDSEYLQYINNFALNNEECRAAIMKHCQQKYIEPVAWIEDNSPHLVQSAFSAPVDNISPSLLEHVDKATLPEQLLSHIDTQWMDGNLFLPLDEGLAARADEVSATHAQRENIPSFYGGCQVSAENNMREYALSTSTASHLSANHEGAEQALVTLSSLTPLTPRVHSINGITPSPIGNNSSPSGKTLFNVLTKDDSSLKYKLKMLQQKMRQAKKKVEDLKSLLSNLDQEPNVRAELLNIISPELDKIIWCMMEDKDFDEKDPAVLEQTHRVHCDVPYM